MWLSGDSKIVLECLKVEQERIMEEQGNSNKLPTLKPGVKNEIYYLSDSTKFLYIKPESESDEPKYGLYSWGDLKSEIK